MAGRIAFFDVDYTLLTTNSMMLFINYMRRAGEYGLKEIVFGLFYLIQYKLNLLDIEKATEKASKPYKGMREERLIELCNRWFEEVVRDYIYPDAIGLIDQHRKAGDELCLLTAITNYLAEPLANYLKIENYCCNRMEVENGVFTGRMVKPLCYGKAKLDYAKEFAEQKGVNLADCTYYTDSITDLAVLEGIGYPVATNPDPLLRREALKRGWRIIDLKKPLSQK